MAMEGFEQALYL